MADDIKGELVSFAEILEHLERLLRFARPVCISTPDVEVDWVNHHHVRTEHLEHLLLERLNGLWIINAESSVH